MYDNVDYVLAAYFGSAAASSEEEAVAYLLESVRGSDVLASTLKVEVEQALHDDGYSWKSVFEKYEIAFFDSEEKARSHARHILWDSLFV
ncbi:hypothetical protein GIY62_17385 [Burkholderia plantarii]|uniref:hypothetical protein n=1 Tax=Burkholderia plantarii TaxID=41899 RepID=UPI002729B8FC|nr:hypothetical protein [Burkholderia plantarii]WLE58857.1 hypothetical protein GIY62_17385 [Burkholderia plantarii]